FARACRWRERRPRTPPAPTRRAACRASPTRAPPDRRLDRRRSAVRPERTIAPARRRGGLRGDESRRRAMVPVPAPSVHERATTSICDIRGRSTLSLSSANSLRLARHRILSSWPPILTAGAPARQQNSERTHPPSTVASRALSMLSYLRCLFGYERQR